MTLPTCDARNGERAGHDHDVLGLVGVLGGMGPLATINFILKVWAATPATFDQDHVPLIVSAIGPHRWPSRSA